MSIASVTNKKCYAAFGPGGNSESFYASGYKRTVDAPEYVRNFGLDAYEYEAGNGITAGEMTLSAIGEAARVHNVKMSLHAPYYITLSGVDPAKRLGSIDIIVRSLDAALLLGAETVVVHTGSAAKISREEAMKLAADTLYKTLEVIGDTPVKIGLETMGKVNQLGTLDEVIELCKIDSRLAPVVDFGHMNARACGSVFDTAEKYYAVFDKIGDALGDDVAKNLHCHFSKIEWTAAGEKRHLTFDDDKFGPAYEGLIETIVKYGLTPTVICESAGTMAEDALCMKKYYKGLVG